LENTIRRPADRHNDQRANFPILQHPPFMGFDLPILLKFMQKRLHSQDRFEGHCRTARSWYNATIVKVS
jgi:hypothetical protein